jgi:hypothetical protein
MMWLPKTGVYVHLMPVTKLQFEAFICARPSSQFDQKWFDELLALDPKEEKSTARVSPYAVREANYFQAFVTGVRPDEARVYAQWCSEEDRDGRGYFLPSAAQWWQAFEELGGATADDRWAETVTNALGVAGLRLTPRLRELFDRLAPLGGAGAAKRTAADQLLFRHGVMEWVQIKQPGKSEWGGYGQPPSRLLSEMTSSLTQKVPKEQRNALAARLLGYGFRLFREGN